MKIIIRARSFFKARMGTFREAGLFRNNRIISINSVSFPAGRRRFPENVSMRRIC